MTRELAEAAAFDRHGVFVVGGGLVLAGAVKPGLGPGAGRERFELLDQLRGALSEGDEPDAHLVEFGEVLLGGELLIEHQ